MPVDVGLAGIARVAYEATGLPQFTRDNAQAEHAYRSSTAGMTDGSLRLELAQDRLRRTVAKGPSAYRELARAELQVRQAEAALAAESRRTSGALNAEERSLGRLSRGALAGSGIMHGLGRSVAFASTSFLGGAGLVYAIRSSIKAAQEQSAIIANLKNSLQVGGHSWEQYGQQIESATASLKRQSAFDDEDLYKSLQLLIRGTGDVTKSLRLNAEAADIARARNKDLAQTATALAKSTVGQETALRRLVPGLDKNLHGYALIEDAAKKSAGAAQAFASSAAGAQARFTVAIQDTEKAVGRELLPTVTALLSKGATWLNDTRNQERIQRDVNEAVRVGSGVVKTLAHDIDHIHAVLAPVVRLLGGTEKAVELAFGAYLIRKLTIARAGITGLIGSIRGIGTAAAVSAAQADRSIASIGATATAQIPRVAALAGAESTLAGRIGQYGTPGVLPGGPAPKKAGRIPGAFGAAGEIAAGIFGAVPDQLQTRFFNKNGRRYAQFQMPDGTWSKPRDVGSAKVDLKPGRGPTAEEILQGLQGDQGGPFGFHTPTFQELLEQAGFNASNRPRGGGKGPSATLPRRLTDAALRASLTASDADDLRAAQAEETFLRKQLGRAKKGTKLYSDILAAVVAAHSQTQSVQDRIDAENKRHRDALSAKRKKAAAAAARDRKADADQVYRDSVRIAEHPLVAPDSPRLKSPLGRTTVDKSHASSSGPVDVAAELREYTQALQDIVARYAPNFGPDTHAKVIEHLTRQQNDHLRAIRHRTSFPEAAYVGSPVRAGFDG